jgi:23S rRNA pseudouridine2605 synthase
MNDQPDDKDFPPDAVPATPDAEAKPARRRRAPREGAAAPETAAGDAPPPAVAEGDATPAPAPAVEGGVEPSDRPRRKRRRGRKGKGPREGQPAAAAMPQGGGAPIERPPMPDAGELFANVTAGQFDSEVEVEAEAEASAAASEAPLEDAAPERRVLAPDADAPKLQKVLAQSGVGSRRDLEQMIADGRVSVNDEVAHTGQRVSWGDRVAIDGKPVKVRIAPLPTRVIAYHKPTGEVVTLDDPEGRPTVFRRLGRLDINTEGLLLFTTSGELANRLMHPRFGIEREYAVRVLGQLTSESKDKLLAGVPIDGQPCAFQRIEDGGGEGANHWYRVVINEGRNREVRKLFDSVGMAVSRLIRIRYGSVVLPRGLKRGVAVDLSEDDVALLRRLTGLGEGRGPRQGGKDNKDNKPRGRGRGDAGPPAQREPREPRPPREAKEPRSHLSRDLKPPRAGRRGNGDKVTLHDGFGDAALRAREHEFTDHHHDEPPPAEFVNIPNPLQQTFDRRAAREAQRTQRELSDDAPIPNPLQQTYDQRALKAAARAPAREIDDDGPIPNPLQQHYDKRFHKGGPAGGAGGGPRRGGGGGKKRGGGGGKPMGGSQPDPMRTAVGYIGADALHGKKGSRGGGGGGRGRRGGGPKGR